jgi:Sulfotransferase domain
VARQVSHWPPVERLSPRNPCFGAGERSVAIIWHLVHELAENEFMPLGFVERKLPDFVIIGAAKSASTWLHLALRQHPAIYMPESETPFFEDAYYDEKDLSGLYKATDSAPSDAKVGIKCPNYLCTPECAPRLARHLPNARLIAILRNPVDRALSQYYHDIRTGRLPLAPADVAFSRYLRGEFDPPYAKRLILEFGLYAQGISNHLRVFPSEQLLVITDLELRKDLRGVFERACRFVGVADDFVPANIAMPRNQGAYFSPFLWLTMSLNRRGITFDAQTGLEHPRRDFVSWGARRLAVLTSRMSAATRLFVRDQEPTVSFKTRSGLLEYYLPDILKLQELTQIDLSPWKTLRQA